MNTLRVSGPLDVGRRPVGMIVGMVAVTIVLCGAVFAGSYAIGRAQRPRAASNEQLATNLPAGAAGPAIPVRLSSAPAIAGEASTVARTPAQVTHRVTVVSGVAATTVPITEPVFTPAVPSPATTPAAKAPVTSTAPTTHTSPHQQSSSGGSHGSSGGAKTGTSGGTSFDSSG